MTTHPPQDPRKQGPKPPLKEVPQPAELAPLYVFLESQAAASITGQVYGITGGTPLV